VLQYTHRGDRVVESMGCMVTCFCMLNETSSGHNGMALVKLNIYISYVMQL
jgi:hypothetical protein